MWLEMARGWLHIVLYCNVHALVILLCNYEMLIDLLQRTTSIDTDTAASLIMAT